jgi:hypothetical protein
MKAWLKPPRRLLLILFLLTLVSVSAGDGRVETARSRSGSSKDAGVVWVEWGTEGQYVAIRVRDRGVGSTFTMLLPGE